MAANSDIQRGTIKPELEINNTFHSTVNAIYLAEKLSIKVFCFTSSSAIYGETNNKLKENYGPLKPISRYGAMKVASEAILSSSLDLFNKIFIFRFPNVISGDVTHGLFYDIPKKIRNNNLIKVLGNGLQTNPYMHINTLIRIIIFLYKLKKIDKINIFNIGPDDQGIKVKDIIKKFIHIKNLTNKTFKYENKIRGWKGDVVKYTFDITKIKKIITFKIPSSANAVEKTIKEIKI